MVILLNKSSNSGNAALKWNKIKPHIFNKFPEINIIEANNIADNLIIDAVANGEKEFISAGGDGTLNFLINILMRNSFDLEINKFKIGAIGLGSSNDFHKPYNKSIDSIPARIDFANCEACDVGVIEYVDEDSSVNIKYWVINSSIGILADANKYFNHKGLIWDLFKRSFVGGAILYSALTTIAKYKNKNCSLSSENLINRNAVISNIGITKNPNFAGDFSYPVSYNPSNGLFNFHLLENSNLFETLLTLRKLWKNKKNPILNIQSGETNSIEISSDNPINIEYDGEVISTVKAKFSIMTKAINLCR